MAAAGEIDRPDDDRGLYLYAIVPEADAPRSHGVSGVAGEDVFAIGGDGVAAIVGSVPMGEFDEEPLRRNLNDVAWLERVARAHEAVVEHAMGAGTVLPARLATIFRRRKDVAVMLERERARLVEGLERVRGAREWGVKAFADPDGVAEFVRRSTSEEAASREPVERTSEGKGYFARKAHDASVREAALEVKARCARSTHERLGSLAAETRLQPLATNALASADGEPILNGAYLVSLEGEDAFRAAMRTLEAELAPLGVTLHLTGPWPPYNFVETVAPGE